MNLGPAEIALIILAVLLLFGYKKLPDASRSMGRSLRIFKSEMKGMKDDDVRAKDEARTAPVAGEIVAPPVSPPAPGAGGTAPPPVPPPAAPPPSTTRQRPGRRRPARPRPGRAPSRP